MRQAASAGSQTVIVNRKWQHLLCAVHDHNRDHAWYTFRRLCLVSIQAVKGTTPPPPVFHGCALSAVFPPLLPPVGLDFLHILVFIAQLHNLDTMKLH